MNMVMHWIGVAWSVASVTVAFLTGLAKIFPKVPFFGIAASALGTLVLDMQKLLGTETPK